MQTHTHTTTDDQHRAGIQAMFDLVAPRYDLMNDLMSMGTHRLWKRRVVGLASGSGTAVDLAGGTGDIAQLLVKNDWHVTVCDASQAMMKAGRERGVKNANWVAGLGEKLPFSDNSIDLLTIGFGLRNMTLPQEALCEAHRVLKPGGMFLCLEFSTPQAWLRPFYNWYSDHIIPRLGAAIAGRREAYRYLVDSIREFPDQETLKAQMQRAGFESVNYQNLSFGIAAIHQGSKAP
ncbi:MAG: bifunctional demethylmenaquinone methyltransferase/2-methoxy-6-polyprenyl-1,4-benzoquinol methylase UbiE [Magnetovibrio sp.]|nr:bifunctional demethylmenaquinone methyltransferase/2-methoxy-6-polyprenyl-1,4-benzoquinol methylase UbiE [Magnetovibrio sp.]